MKEKLVIKKSAQQLQILLLKVYPKKKKEEADWLENKLDFAPFRTLYFSLDTDTEIAYIGTFF